MPKFDYRTRDGGAVFGFSFEEQSDRTVRAYITSQPGYQGRADDGHSTHRYTEGARHYICWSEPLKSVGSAKAVAAQWADSTQNYIRTGRTFGN